MKGGFGPLPEGEGVVTTDICKTFRGFGFEPDIYPDVWTERPPQSKQ
jgi:hypothetical protein